MLVEDEEKQGFSLAVEEALDSDGNAFTEEEGLDSEEAFTLIMGSALTDDQNYEAGDVEVATLSSSVEVAEEAEGTIDADGTEVATYVVNADGEIEFTFLEGIESAGAAASPVDVEVLVNEDSVDEEFAYIAPIGAEEQLVVPLAVEEEDEGATEEEVEEEESTEESSETEEQNERSIGTFAEVSDNIFTFNSLSVDGNEIEDGAYIEVNEDTEVQLQFDWNTEGVDVQEGDTASMQLPAIFGQITTPETPIVTSGITVGTYSIQNGELIFVFNNNIEDGDVSNGEVGLSLSFNMEIFEENIEQVIEFNDSVDTTLNVIARPTETASGITKEGHPDQDHNASEITWTVDVMNNSEDAVSNATLTDILPEGLGSPEDFVVTSLSTGLSGDKVTGDTVDIPVNVDGSTFNMNLNTLEPFQGYRVQYTTPITDSTQESFTNNAVFYDGNSELPADATVSGLTSSNPIEKSGEYNSESGQIDWTIVANENGNDIENAIIADELPAGLILDGETLTVEHYVDNSHAGNLEFETNDFPINLGETAANEYYVVNFSTDIDYGEVNEGEYQDISSFTNSAILNNGDDELARDDATVEFDREPLLEKTGESLVNYDNNTLSWTIDVNRAKHSLTNLVITDVIPAGLNISEDDIEITSDEDGVISAEDITINEGEDGEQEVVITLGDIGTQHITIEYTTEIEDFNINTFNNTVGIGGDGIGEGDYDTGHEINPPGNSFDKFHLGTNYSEKTMEWQFTVNPRREALNELQIVDTFTNDGLILLPDTLTITIGDQAITDGFTLTPNTEGEETGYQKGFTLNFDESILPLNNNMIITYETSYDPQRVVEGNTLDPHVNNDETQLSYVNHAQFTGITENGNDINLGRDASDEVREDSWNSGKKEGQLINVDSEGNQTEDWQSGSERMIAWQLYTNYQQQNLGKDVVITDTLQYEGAIDEASIRVSTYEVNADGGTNITEEVLDSSAYTLNVTGDEFTLTFNQEVTERYVIEFLTTVPDTSEDVYTNEAIVSVGDDDYPYTSTVEYSQFDEFLDKSAIGQEGNDIYIGEEINWEVQVNDSLSVIDNAVIRDIMSDGLEYVQGSLEVTTGSGNTLSEGLDYILTTNETGNDETILTIELNDTLSESLTLNYTTVVTAEDGATVDNTVALNGDNIENVSVTSEALNAEQFSWVSGEFNENRGALQIIKADSETGEPIGNNPATFALYYELNGERVLFADNLATNDEGELLIGNLPLRTYYIQETEAPTGYVIDEEEQEIEVTEPYGTDANVYETEFTNTKTKTDISVTKEWNDAENQDGTRPESVAIQLLANGENEGESVTLSEENDWAHTWSDLDEYQSNGEIIDYTVEEVEVPEGYESSTEIAEDGSVTVINTHVPETMEVSVSKIWEDGEDQDGERPNNVTVNLLSNSEIVTEVVLNESNEWQHTFEDLPRFSNGEEIGYSVTENTVANYSTSIEMTNIDAGLNSVVTNTYTPEQTTATVTKVWDDGGNQDGNRPETVTAQLLADGESQGEPVVLTAAENWTHTWTDLDLNAGGDAIDYTVQEINAPEGYEVSLNNEDHGNLVITNSYEPEVTDVSVSKTWEDAENQDGVRPNNVTINLLADGEIERTAVVDANGDWEHTFTDLPVYDNGTEINYTVTENTVEDYSASIVEESENNFVVTNTHTPDETSVTVTKAWDDANNQDGNRPTNINVQLTADGEPVGDAEPLTADNDWTNTWDGLPANAEGEAINYSVEELNVPEGYTSSLNDEDHGNIVVTNSYTPELTEVSVSKVWDDVDNQDGDRNRNITLNLLNDRGEIVRSAVVEEQEGNEWAYTFTSIPMYENGTEINYRVTENFVSDYSTDLEQNEDGVHVITNSYTPDETSVTVTKGWSDANDQDGERPESIEVQLTAGGEATGEPVALSEENNWTHTWNELALNSDGEAIAYSVEELNVPEGYTSSINDADHGNIIVANSYTPSLIDIPVEKAWDDEDDQDRVRPGQVIVNLINGAGELEARVILNDDNDWQHTFTDLPEYANGELINYTITENSVEDYSTNIEENADDVRVVTNSYTPEETSVTVVKGWEDGNNQDGNRPESIEVQLLANGEPEGNAVEITAEDEWTHTWDELDANEAGEAIEYSVEELNASEEYEVSLNDADHGNIILTNSYTPETTEISGTKTWDDADNQDGLRSDSITVNLLANGEQVDSDQASQETGWSYNFTDLPVYEAGEEIEYTIEEVAVEGYETEIDGFDIMNSHTPATTDVSGTKTWNDADNQDGERPDSITVNLLADGEQVDSVEVNEGTDWMYSFEDLPVFEAGEEIIYTVTEGAESGYTVTFEETEEGYDITNTYTPGETSVTATKAWDDANNQDGTREDSIDVQLTADGEEIGDPVTLSGDNNWTNTWSGLDEMSEGQAIDYAVIELNVPESYEVEINDEDHGNIIITNSYTPETTEATVSKVWDDNDNQDGNRPNNVTVNLLNNSEIVTEAVLNEDNDWQHTFTDLPVYEDGQEIQYSITENTVAGYSTSIDTTSTDEGLSSVVTNTYTPEETTATVTKVWNDGNNQDGNRPETVDVQLFADSEAHGEPIELTAAENWTHTWTGLDLNSSGEAINYTVQEVNVAEGYTSAVNNNDHGNLVITNISEPEVTEVNVSKAWEDEENQDDIRPDNVTINLLADGEIERTAVVDADGDWEHTFTNLPVNDNGSEINYTVTENTVENYSASIVEESENSFVVTNTYTPEETSVTAVKAWDDSNNQDGARPDSVEVQLTADGEEIGEPVNLSTENDWTNTWDGLSLNNDGESINYSVEELDIPEGYTVSINDEDHGSIIITNSYTPETIEVPVAKVWDDNDNQDGVRPNNVTANLVDDEGKVIEQVILSEDNEWQYTFTDLPANALGETVNYTVTENAVTDYSTSLAQNDDGVNVITNTYTPGETSVTVTKGWKDKKNKDARPDSVKVQLTTDGKETGEAVTLSAENNWTHTWDGLAENNDGTAIEYSVEELNVPEGYRAFIKDANHGNIIVINSYTAEDGKIPEPGKDPEDPSEGEESPEDSKDEGTPGTEEGEETPTDSTDEGSPGSEEGGGTPTDSTDEGTSESQEDDGTPTGSSDEGTPGSGEGEGTSEGSLPLTGVALGSTIAIFAGLLLAAGAALLFFTRRRS